jgi:hypothetical protein
MLYVRMSSTLVIGRKRNAFWHSFTVGEELVLDNFINIFVTENSTECLSLEKSGQDSVP